MGIISSLHNQRQIRQTTIKRMTQDRKIIHEDFYELFHYMREDGHYVSLKGDWCITQTKHTWWICKKQLTRTRKRAQNFWTGSSITEMGNNPMVNTKEIFEFSHHLFAVLRTRVIHFSPNITQCARPDHLPENCILRTIKIIFPALQKTYHVMRHNPC